MGNTYPLPKNVKNNDYISLDISSKYLESINFMLSFHFGSEYGITSKSEDLSMYTLVTIKEGILLVLSLWAVPLVDELIGIKLLPITSL